MQNIKITEICLLLVVLTLCITFALGKIEPALFLGIAGTIVGFFFGNKSGEQQAAAAIAAGKGQQIG